MLNLGSLSAARKDAATADALEETLEERRQHFIKTQAVPVDPNVMRAKVFEHSWSTLRRCAWLCGCVAVAASAAYAPGLWMRFQTRRAFRSACRGTVLDLTPKPFDAQYVGMFAVSGNVHSVAYLAGQHVAPDVTARSLRYEDEAVADAKQRDMLLRDAVAEDAILLLDSTIRFELVTSAELAGKKYDTVVIRDELTGLEEGDARALLKRAVAAMLPGGKGLLIDYGAPRNAAARRALAFFAAESGSELRLTHDYEAMLAAVGAVVESNRRLIGGAYQIIVFRRATDAASSDQGAAASAT